MKTQSHYKPLYLNLYNFNTLAAQDCPYVLTSPRSLEACRKAGYKVSYYTTVLPTKIQCFKLCLRSNFTNIFLWVNNNYTNSYGKNKIAPYLIIMLLKVTFCIFQMLALMEMNGSNMFQSPYPQGEKSPSATGQKGSKASLDAVVKSKILTHARFKPRLRIPQPVIYLNYHYSDRYSLFFYL